MSTTRPAKSCLKCHTRDGGGCYLLSPEAGTLERLRCGEEAVEEGRQPRRDLAVWPRRGVESSGEGERQETDVMVWAMLGLD